MELIKRPTHLRAGPGDVVHQGQTPLSSFFFSYLMIISLFFWSFPSLWCTLVYAHLIQFFNKSLDENIPNHVGIRAVIFDLNCWVWMLTRAKHKQGEGTLRMFNPKVGRASWRKKMVGEDKFDEEEKKFCSLAPKWGILMYFAQFFYGVNKKTYPFESRTRRRSPPGTNSVIKFLCSFSFLCLFPLELFLLYGVL